MNYNLKLRKYGNYILYIPAQCFSHDPARHAATRRGGQQQSQQKGFMINSHDLVFMVQRWEL